VSEITIRETSAVERDETPGKARFLERHPCFSGEAHLKFGRIHLPVSPACNIGCLFCARGIRPEGEERDNVPGVASRVLKPVEAMAILEKALALCPEIAVVGVAGPGDSLVTDYALETLELAKARFPHLLACLSTNGLLLRDKVERLAAIPVDSITVTVNSLRPETLEKINSRVIIGGRVLRGREAAETLIEAQLLGIAAASAQTKAVIKINTVLIPGLNDGEIAEIAKHTAGLGATVMNVLPLIPQMGMADRSAPDCMQIEAARRAAGEFLDVFRHCKHCRADAAGIMGKNHDISKLLYGDAPAAEESFSHG
jgi:nitrogen fixation protein NifB